MQHKKLLPRRFYSYQGEVYRIPQAFLLLKVLREGRRDL